VPRQPWATGTVPFVAEPSARVTIGIPVYNGERRIRHVLDSLLAQDYPDIEIVVSDNASTDDTVAIVEEYVRHDGRILVERNETNTGAVPNFRKALRLARSAYFMWAAVDDDWEPTFVSRMVGELDAHADAGIAFSAVDLVDDEGSPLGEVRFQGEDNPGRLSHWALAHRILSPRKYNLWIYGLFRTERLREAMDRLPDVWAWDRWLVLAIALSDRLRYVDEPLHRRTVRPRPASSARHEASTGLRTAIILLRVLMFAPFIPLRRRLWSPLVVAHYAGTAGKAVVRAALTRLRAKLGSPSRRRVGG